MTDLPADDPFVTMASAHIDLANSQAATHPRELAAAAILHAAARYNAFIGMGLARSSSELAALHGDLIDEQVAQFRDALAHHYKGYIAELDAQS